MHRPICACLMFLSAPALANDQMPSIEAGISTMGIYVAPRLQLRDTLAARLPIWFGSASGDFTDDDGNTINGDVSNSTFALIADYHPFANGFRVSGGVSVGGYEVSGTGTDLTLDGTLFSGDFDVDLRPRNDVFPMLSAGFVQNLGNVNVLADFGARFGTYEVTATGGSLSAVEQSNFDAEIEAINDDLSDIRMIPFITLGVSLNF